MKITQYARDPAFRKYDEYGNAVTVFADGYYAYYVDGAGCKDLTHYRGYRGQLIRELAKRGYNLAASPVVEKTPAATAPCADIEVPNEEPTAWEEPMFGVLSAWGLPTNSAYDPRTANNGGGYWQYAGGILAEVGGELVTVEVDNQSCGDFGTRIYIEVFTGEFNWCVGIGSMDDVSIQEPEEIDEIYASISGVLGIDAAVLIREAIDAADLCAWQEEST